MRPKSNNEEGTLSILTRNILVGVCVLAVGIAYAVWLNWPEIVEWWVEWVEEQTAGDPPAEPPDGNGEGQST